MNRYPDQIIILEPVGGDTYHAPSWRQVYTGRCRCFLNKPAAFRTNEIMDCDYQVVIPDRNMPTIGENNRVGVKMHTDPSNVNWNLVGYVKDFARYDRVCNLYFQMVKENLIYEDMPAPALDLSKRTNMTYDDEWLHIESVGLVNNDKIAEEETCTLFANKDGWIDDHGAKWAIGIEMRYINPNTGEEEKATASCPSLAFLNERIHFRTNKQIMVFATRYLDHYEQTYPDYEQAVYVVLTHFDEESGENIEFYRKKLNILKAE